MELLCGQIRVQKLVNEVALCSGLWSQSHRLDSSLLADTGDEAEKEIQIQEEKLRVERHRKQEPGQRNDVDNEEKEKIR